MSVPDRLLGVRVVAVKDLTRPWTTAVRTSQATLDDGRRVIHQEGEATRVGRAGIRHRIRFTVALLAAAPALPVPDVLDGDPAADPPFVVTRLVEGVTGDRLLETVGDAADLGALAGGVAAAVAAIPPRAIRARLPRAWGDQASLGAAARRWLRDTGSALDPAGGDAARGAIVRIPGLFHAPPVLAHGDLAPVNLVVDGGRPAALLDLERLRCAPVGFDAAWFRLLVRHHHPAAWTAAGPALLGRLGLSDDPVTVRRLDDLALLACLEVLAGLPRRDPRRADWAARIREIAGDVR